ncbi:MAG: fumarylacetoacetate hydrolase family protein [Oscillospiraceae bacterium]|nr:fumarylacetoacetate hydrolase family protein [Oscillospiraceae bacterium]
MQLCSIEIDGRPRVGAKTEKGVADLTAAGFPSSMNEVILGGETMLKRISEAMQKSDLPAYDAQSIKYLPVTKPAKIICEGLNYTSHAEETGGEAPKYPIFFSKFEDSLSAHNQPVKLPPWLTRYDYEAELVVVIGRHAYNIPAETAGEYIFGYACGNDLSARDSQFLSTQWLTGKALPGFAPVGPFILTSDSFDPEKSNGIYCEVNGETVQAGDTADMIFTCRTALYEASKYFPLSPGDLIFTGTPAGVIQGRKREERVWLKAGDIVKVRIDGIGELTTPLI